MTTAQEYLEKRGVFCHVERTEEGRDALYASTVPGKTCEYGFVTHVDVVPAAGPEQFEPKIVGDEIFARGACDTKVNAALIAQVLVALKGKASVGAFFATDEDGCVGKVPTCTMLRRAGYAPTKMVLVGDTGGGDTNKLKIAQKGHWGFRLTARGRGGHSSIPWKLDNAIPKVVEATQKLMAAYPKPPPDGGWCSTLAPTILAAGDAPNSIPGEASVTFSFRYVGKDDGEPAQADRGGDGNRARDALLRPAGGERPRRSARPRPVRRDEPPLDEPAAGAHERKRRH